MEYLGRKIRSVNDRKKECEILARGSIRKERRNLSVKDSQVRSNEQASGARSLSVNHVNFSPGRR